MLSAIFAEAYSSFDMSGVNSSSLMGVASQVIQLVNSQLLGGSILRFGRDFLDHFLHIPHRAAGLAVTTAVPGFGNL